MSKKKRGSYYLMSQISKGLTARQRLKKKINYFPLIESYCVCKGFCFKEWTTNYAGYLVLQYELTPGLEITEQLIGQAVEELEQIKIKG
ncbi:hypothetical protein NIES267_74110 (plasmid) [Calothrix parasitica NIES-267]|uniref:Uncharacterized protein n=1 Tax=Calothrix parasitica NIES-267 TaxID=1973488 RepID=A0A1Z4M341_9CYAN|nr:hypothetical protein NIES267_74110 [Calothrix parasitica NIES-267]